MELSKEHIRSCIFIHFASNKTTRQAKTELDVALGAAAPTLRCIQAWYQRFRLFQRFSKRMFALFFRKSGFVALRMLKRGETVQAKWYQRTLVEVFKNMRKIRPRTGLRGISLHQDNASSHTAKSTLNFLKRNGVALTGHPPHSPTSRP